jgi:hypothetical protein
MAYKHDAKAPQCYVIRTLSCWISSYSAQQFKICWAQKFFYSKYVFCRRLHSDSPNGRTTRPRLLRYATRHWSALGVRHKCGEEAGVLSYVAIRLISLIDTKPTPVGRGADCTVETSMSEIDPRGQSIKMANLSSPLTLFEWLSMLILDRVFREGTAG